MAVHQESAPYTDQSMEVGSSEISTSSGSLSLVPASPQIFHGRESELEDVFCTLLQHAARVVILGTGGMGKTALALASLHHPGVEQKYPHRHFISCESANSCGELISIVGAHLGLEQSRQLSKAIFSHFSNCSPALLVLDNMETPWEPASTRTKVEDFLSLLADVPHLALLITMRGAERPGKVKWTRPFLPPLEPISILASRQTFVDIADEPMFDEEPAVAELIELTGNLPLAVRLLANVASSEGYLGALARWKSENIALLSDGYDKRSNLERSISISLTSPRIKSNPHALDLLSLISLLPDGISEDELLASHVPLPRIPHCKSSLLQTSLAFLVDGRLKTLSPIRDYIRSAHPAGIIITRPLRTYFQDLLRVWETYYGLSKDLVPQLTSHLGNIHSLFLDSMTREVSTQVEIGTSILTLNLFSERMLKGRTPLMDHLPAIVNFSHDLDLKWRYVCSCVESREYVDGLNGTRMLAPSVESLASQGVEYFINKNDPEGQVGAYLTLSTYYEKVGDVHKALEFNKLGMDLATVHNHVRYQLRALLRRAIIESSLGKYHESIRHFREVQKLARLTGRIHEECTSVGDEAIPLCRLGKFTEALECASCGHELLLKNGLEDSDVELAFLDQTAEIHFQKSEYTEARQLTDRVMHMTGRHRSVFFHANALRALAQIDIITGKDESVILPNLTAARELATQLSWPHALILCDISQCELDIRNGDTTKAHALLTTLVATTELDAEVVYLSLEILGDLSNRICGLAEKFRWAATYFAFAMKTEDLGHTYQALRCLGDIFLAQGDEETALSVFQAVLDGSTEMDVHGRRGDCMSRMGDILMRRGERARAKEMWEAARPLFARSSLGKDVAGMDSKLTQLARRNSGADGGANLSSLSNIHPTSDPSETQPDSIRREEVAVNF
ncbi:hypothetical protein DFH09DRAFT_287520 [Mycena vulgaris]|nr:hypothetical protein DFH09DRAFT_287520 [Mycena vulgaris]